MPDTSTALTQAIRQRMSLLDDTELLRLWVENDRGHYSDEAFEAVRAVLEERGVELPAQNDPPPMATRLPPARQSVETVVGRDPSAAYWLRWLRGMLWTGVVLEGIRLVSAVAALAAFLDLFNTSPRPPFAASGGTLWQWLASSAAREIAILMFLSAWFLVATWWAMRLRPRARHALLAYSYGTMLAAALIHGVRFHQAYADVPIAWYLAVASEAIRPLAYPFLLLLFLTRPQIKALFEPVIAGFEVRQAGTV